MRFIDSRMSRLFAFFAAVLFCTANVYAQTNTGGVRGEVKDIQGASIPQAQVTLTNQDTHVSHTVVTNAAGGYLFPAIDPGNYTVSVAMPGFKEYKTTNNVITLDALLTVDATLQIGAATDTIEVTADTLTLNTANASGAQLFDEKQLQTLPNLGRNPFMFATLDANVVTLGDPRYVRAEDSTGSSQVSLSGAPSGSNSYVVDGIPVSTSSGGETFVVSPEAVSDAKIQSDTFDAEIGRSGGGVFNTSFKAGSAQYHGVLYGETRQTAWSANNYFNYPTTPGGPVAATPNDATYLYAGAFGGPVPFSQKNRWTKDTFFWITEEGYRQGQPNTGTNQYYVPTTAERAGDFTAYAPANGSTTSCTGTTGMAGTTVPCFIIYDPTTSPTAAGGRVSYLTETGFNKVPTTAINTIGQAIASDFPAPTGGSASAVYGTGLNYSIPVMSIKTRSDEYIGKLEHTFAPWWTSAVSYLHDAVQEPDVSFLLTNFGAANTKLIRYFDATSLTNTFTVNPTTLLTVGYGFNRYYSASPPYSTGFNQGTGFNGTGFGSYLTSNQASKTFPSITLSGTNNGAAALGGSYGGPGVQASHNLIAILSKTLGKNDLRFGYAFRAFTYFQNTETGSAGLFTFSGQNTNSAGASSTSNGPTSIADLLVGDPATATMQINAAPFANKETYNSLFVQDDYRLSSKLTINAGLRYEYELGQFEAHNKLNVGFSTTATSSYANASAVTQNLTGGILFAGAGAPTHCCNQSHVKFSPRIGMAWQVAKDTVVHAGYGLFYAPIGIVAATQGYSQLTSYAPGNTTTVAPVGAAGCLSTPYNGGACGSALLQPSGNTLGPLTGIGGTIGTLPDFHRGFPLVQQYMLDVERRLPFDIILKVAYIGAHGTNFLNNVNINQMPTSALIAASQSGTNLSTKITNPLYAHTVAGYPATGILSNTTYAQGQFLLPFPQYTSVTVSESNGFSWYNSLSFKAEKRVTQGLTVLATYTWSSNWDNIYTTGSQVYETFGPQDNNNIIKGEYARSINSVPNRVTMAITEDLPFGKGRKFLGHPSGLMGHVTDFVLGGYQVNYEQVIQNGVPMSVVQTDLSTSTYGSTSYGGAYQRPNIIGDPHSACLSGKPQTRLGYFSSSLPAERRYLNVNAFSATLPYQFGNVSRSLPCRVPGSDTATASITKNFNIHGRLVFQFRVEALNLWNTPQFSFQEATTPYTLNVTGTGVNTAPAIATGNTLQGLGNLNTQIGFSRVIQMGGRISF